MIAPPTAAVREKPRPQSTSLAIDISFWWRGLRGCSKVGVCQRREDQAKTSGNDRARPRCLSQITRFIHTMSVLADSN